MTTRTKLVSLTLALAAGVILLLHKSPEAAVRGAVNEWLTSMKNGHTGAECWIIPERAVSLFSVRRWTILATQCKATPGERGNYFASARIRVEAATRGGLPITIDRTVYLINTNHGAASDWLLMELVP